MTCDCVMWAVTSDAVCWYMINRGEVSECEDISNCNQMVIATDP